MPSALGWRGIFAAHIILVDLWLLAGGHTSKLPSAVRTHWAAEPGWLILSFASVAIGLHELCAVCEGWLGSTLVPADLPNNTSTLFAGLSVVHVISIIFATNMTHRSASTAAPRTPVPAPEPCFPRVDV